MTDLLHDVVWIGSGESGGLEQVHDIELRHSLAVQEVLILLCSDHAPQVNLVFVNLEQQKLPDQSLKPHIVSALSTQIIHQWWLIIISL